MDELTRLGINFVPKDKNSPNVPQLRPIEDFWANLKRKVYANNYTSKNIKCLKNKIKLELEKMQHSEFSKAMKHVPVKYRKGASSGLNTFIHRLQVFIITVANFTDHTLDCNWMKSITWAKRIC